MHSDINSLKHWLSQADQGDAVACYNAGVIFQEQSDIPAAINYYEKAIQLNPMLAEAYNNLGGIYKEKDEPDKALSYYLQALNINPHFANINNNIGVILQNQKNAKDALRFFNKALSLDATCATTYYNMGLIHEDQTMFAQAANYYKKAYELDPQSAIPYYWSSQMVLIQDLYLNHQKYEEAISKLISLSNWAKDNHVLGEKVVGFSTPFYLTYQETDNRDFFSVYGDTCVSLMSYLNPTAPLKSQKNGKIRIGIASDHLHGHSVWHAVLKGWYQHLDKTKFEIYSFYLGKKHNDEYELAKEKSDYFIEGKFYDTQQWRDIIMAQQSDVLIFSAIGMDWKMQQLASLRLAPVQITTWGHPETSGLPTIDYYLSGADFEPAEAQTYYREKLVCLPNLGSCYEPLQLPADEFDIAELGVNADTCLLIAPGTPFKYQAQYDYIYPEIAVRIQNAKIVFFLSKPDGLSEAFKQRIKSAFTEKGLDMHEHAIFIPSVRKPRFHDLLKQAHVYLDTIGFSGFNTFMQAMECGLPAVSYQGKFMRGRFGSAILHNMQLDDLIATSTEDYIEKVVKLVNDSAFRKAIKEKIEQTVPQLYSDISVIRALEAFILSVAK